MSLTFQDPRWLTLSHLLSRGRVGIIVRTESREGYAAHFRLLAATTYVKGHIKHAGCLAVAVRLEEIAIECALKGLDLSDLYAPTPGDALALRGEP